MLVQRTFCYFGSFKTVGPFVTYNGSEQGKKKGTSSIFRKAPRYIQASGLQENQMKIYHKGSVHNIHFAQKPNPIEHQAIGQGHLVIDRGIAKLQRALILNSD